MMMHALGRSTEGDALWRAHATELVRYASLLVGPVDAQDVVSTAFVNVLGGKGRQPDNIRAYLFRAVTNAAIDGQRSSSRRLARDDRHAVLPDRVVAARPAETRDVQRNCARPSSVRRSHG
jgi:DNA-directed RNA polymerase specialized sigma24 family protein